MRILSPKPSVVFEAITAIGFLLFSIILILFLFGSIVMAWSISEFILFSTSSSCVRLLRVKVVIFSPLFWVILPS